MMAPGCLQAQPLPFSGGHKLLLHKSVQPLCLDIVGAAQRPGVPCNRPVISFCLYTTLINPVLQAWGAHLRTHCAIPDTPVTHLIKNCLSSLHSHYPSCRHGLLGWCDCHWSGTEAVGNTAQKLRSCRLPRDSHTKLVSNCCTSQVRADTSYNAACWGQHPCSACLLLVC